MKCSFASANTGDGFFNCFDSIGSADGFQYILKGPSGCGKSTLMRRVADHFTAKGCTIEYFHCSSDPSSLDGVRIVEMDVSIVDGTAPHVTEALMPMITHALVDLGVSVRSEAKAVKAEIAAQMALKKNAYIKVYDCLAQAKKMMDNDGFAAPADGRRLFLSSPETDLTQMNGFSAVLPYTGQGGEVVVLNTIDPGRIDGVIDADVYYKVNRSYPDATLQLVCRAASFISEARECHKRIEDLYRPYIDFGTISCITEELIRKIEG